MPDDHWRLLVSIAEGTVTRARARVGACGLGGCALTVRHAGRLRMQHRGRGRAAGIVRTCPRARPARQSAGGPARPRVAPPWRPPAPPPAEAGRPGVRQCCGASLARLLPAALCGSRRSGALLFCCPPTQGRCGTQRRGASRNKAERQALSLAAALLNIAPDASFFEVMG